MKRIISCLLLLFIFVGCSSKKEIVIEDKELNVIDYSEAKEFDFELYSNNYLLIRLNDFKVLYAHNNSNSIYPASLTKVVTMNNTLRLCDNLEDTSMIDYDDYNELVNANASTAGLIPNVEYSLKDLLYALILPSGGDAALAIGNYYANKGINIVEEMNNRASTLGLNNTNFVNTTGLHDDNHYTSLDDLLVYVIDTLQYYEGREVLETLDYVLEDGSIVTSTVSSVVDDKVEVLGGKTGYTSQAGRCILVLYRFNNRSYLLLLAGANSDDGYSQYCHYIDVKTIFKELYY